MGLKIDSSYNSIKVLKGNNEVLLFKGNTIGMESYKGDTELKEVDILEGVKTISISAFQDCTSLTKVTIPASLKRIEWNAFAGCSALKEMVLPTSLNKVDCCFGRGVSKLTLFNPSSDEIIKMLKQGYAIDLNSHDDHWN